MHLNLVYYYVCNANGSLWITNNLPLKGQTKWMSSNPGQWRKIENHKVTLHPLDMFDSFIRDIDLSDIPEPSWSDSEPTVIHIKMDYSINYYTY